MELELRGVTFAYGSGAPVLEKLSLALPSGSMAALLGPNGAGKSTLLHLAAGLLRPRAGSVCVGGTELGRLSPRERAQRIAMVPQSLPAPFAFTVREWVGLGRTPYLEPLRGEREADRRAVARAMRLAGVEALAERRIAEISGGERQRAALAMALAQEPSLLLLDEATAHLDLHHQQAILATVRRLNREAGLTVLAAIHDPNLAALWFDRLLLLCDGRLAADGPPAEVLREGLLERAFDCRVRVLSHPAHPVPLVLQPGPAEAEPPAGGEGPP